MKLRYLSCHGRLTWPAVALPLLHLRTLASVMYPIRELTVFVNVLVCNDPLILTSHSTGRKPAANPNDLNSMVFLCSETENLAAEQGKTDTLRSTVAPATARSSLLSFME